MYNGKILTFPALEIIPTDDLSVALCDPKAGTINVQTSAWDMFCNGMVVSGWTSLCFGWDHPVRSILWTTTHSDL